MDILSSLRLADELYGRRDRTEEIERSVEMLSALPGANSSYEAQWRLARSLFFLGQQASPGSEKEHMHAAGAGAGERAAALSPDRVEGHFWLGVNLALMAECSGRLRAVKAIIRAKRSLARAAAISSEYHDAGPLRVLARLKHTAPWFLGGSLRQSRQYLDRAIEIAPANSVTLLYAAELALDAGERDRATRLLEQMLASDIDPGWEFENRRDRRLAKEMLARLSSGRAS
jgi:tetratricopeptide (TPR) repeat protein